MRGEWSLAVFKDLYQYFAKNEKDSVEERMYTLGIGFSGRM